MKNVFNVIGLTASATQEFYSLYRDSIKPLLEFWQIQALPDECRIDICFYDKKEFFKILHERHIGIENNIIAISDFQIHAITYNFLNEHFSVEMYQKVLLHECIHMLQLYFSKVPFKEHIWLYEATACYMSKQEININPSSVPEWSSICNNFYSCENCYFWAYEIGKYLFENHTNIQILEICKNPKMAEEIGKEIWQKIRECKIKCVS